MSLLPVSFTYVAPLQLSFAYALVIVQTHGVAYVRRHSLCLCT